MNNWVIEALNMVDTGIIILDNDYKIQFWNRKAEKLSGISSTVAVGKKINDICERFKDEKCQDILETVIHTAQSRFCSSTIHKAFVYSKSAYLSDQIRQNMFVQPIMDEERVAYLMIQITDKTDAIRNEVKIKGLIDELKKSEKQNSMLAKYDTLTGLYNRFAMENVLSNTIEEFKSTDRHFALLFLDLDGFKYVNDTFGHVVGDVLLQHIAGRCKSNITAGDIISRLGGDEFLIALTSKSNMDYYKETAQTLLDAIKRPYKIDNRVINISASIGISVFPEHCETIGGLIQNADFAMYQAKQRGKDQYCIYNEEESACARETK